MPARRRRRCARDLRASQTDWIYPDSTSRAFRARARRRRRTRRETIARSARVASLARSPPRRALDRAIAPRRGRVFPRPRAVIQNPSDTTSRTPDRRLFNCFLTAILPSVPGVVPARRRRRSRPPRARPRARARSRSHPRRRRPSRERKRTSSPRRPPRPPRPPPPSRRRRSAKSSTRIGTRWRTRSRPRARATRSA